MGKIPDKCKGNLKFRWAKLILVQVGSSNFVSKILWLATKVNHSQIFLHSRFSQVMLMWIPIETVLFATCLPTHQDGFQNRDKTYYDKRYFMNGEPSQPTLPATSLRSSAEELFRTNFAE